MNYPQHVLKRVIKDDPILSQVSMDRELQLPGEALANVMANPFIHS